MNDEWAMSIMEDDSLDEGTYWLGLVHRSSGLKISGFLDWGDSGPVHKQIEQNDLLLPASTADRLLVSLLDTWWDNIAHGLTVEGDLPKIVDRAYAHANEAHEVKQMIERALRFHEV